ESTRKGPEPTGFCLKSSPLRSTTALGTIPKPGWPSTDGNDENGLSRWMTTVAGPGVSMPDSPGAEPSLWKAANPDTSSSWASSGDVESLRATRSSVYLTSVAVMGEL